ncbi:MAG: cytochrome c, partial [Pseudomonadales bacterium]|nr:cytochrome c [Pseudomonadales bacterium]
MKRRIILTLTLGLLLWAPALAQSDNTRFLVHAVADADQPRVLVRWAQIEGGDDVYRNYDVLRRTKDESSFSILTTLPVVPLTTAVEIEAVFLDPANADALGWIQDAWGADYASDILVVNTPPLTDDLKFRRIKLAEQNYAAAIAMGLGFMDDAVVNGETYVYEVWGLDEQGFRVERLGRASATAGQPPVLDVVPAQECTQMRDPRGHAAVFTRWDEVPPPRGLYLAGYDVLRVPADGDGNCPPTISLGEPGVVRANAFPVERDSPGNVARGAEVFQNSCVSCHANRNTIAGKTLADFERHSPDFGKTSEHVGLGLGSEDKWAVFRYIEEFHFRDDGDDTPADPIAIGNKYCYVPAPRDLLGQHTVVGASPVACEVQDTLAPAPPMNMASERIVQGDYETCRISWRRNSGADDDTVQYQVFRVPLDQLPRATRDSGIVLPPEVPLAAVPQPMGGERVTWDDADLSIADAGEPYHYGVIAEDAAGNRSRFSSWVPCVPRDIVAPQPPTLTVSCTDEFGNDCCDDRAQDTRWTDAGGLRALFVNSHERCQPRVTCNKGSDAFGCRLLRGYDGLDYRASKDFANDLDIDWEPAVDTRLWVEAQAFDKSMNLSLPSGNGVNFILFGKWRLPPPRISEVILTGDQFNPTVKIRFRSLKPEQLIGFVLYKGKPSVAQRSIGGVEKEFVTSLPAQNLLESPNPGNSDPPVWGPRSSAQALSEIPGFVVPVVPVTPGEYLFYESSTQQYEMQIDIGESENVVLYMAAVGWSGIEGLSTGYMWDGWVRGDGILQWPNFQVFNGRGPLVPQKSQITAVYDGVNEVIDLDWEAWPEGCDTVDDRPFVVYRRRGSSPIWKQMTAPFRCDVNQPTPD